MIYTQVVPASHLTRRVTHHVRPGHDPSRGQRNGPGCQAEWATDAALAGRRSWPVRPWPMSTVAGLTGSWIRPWRAPRRGAGWCSRASGAAGGGQRSRRGCCGVERLSGIVNALVVEDAISRSLS